MQAPHDGGDRPSLAHALPAGLRLGDCRLLRVLGEGGFGIVYLAEDLQRGGAVAVKEYLPAAIASRAADGLSVGVKNPEQAEPFAHGLKGFLNEAHLLARFDHPALVKVHRAWEDHGTAYMAMPYYEGPTLRRLLSGPQSAPGEAEIRAWLMPLLDALETIHRDNCFHRDIAPDNIIVTATGPVLLDFGAARRVIGDLTHTITAVLKPGYAPIEQYGTTEDLKQGPWTDLYALASVLYWAIAREKPPASIDRIVVDRLKPLSSMGLSGYRPALLAAVDQALAVLPGYRPQSVAQFRALLDSEVVASSVPRTPSLLRPTAQTAFGAAALSATPNNLPRQRTSFVGREAESAEVKALLDGSALVTVLGMGGMGKTRLTLQVAGELLPTYPGGVWFVDLSAVADEHLVVPAFARALGLLEEPGRPLVETVCAWLKPRRALLVVDNCEHLVQAVADTVDELLGRAPLVQVLASSREPLDVPGEQAYPLRPLPLPERDAGAETLLQSDAARMFADRARSHRPQFQVVAEEAPALAQLLHRLEGIPLAIELAAARLRTLSLPEIVAGLDDRYRLLEGGSRLLQPRQQTLRALVDWSWDLLSEAERQVFASLAVFAGGFDDAAVRAVCADEQTATEQVDERIAALVQKSLLLAEDDEGAGRRLRLLETLRDYAREKLAASGEADPVSVRHCAHYFGLAKEGARGLHGAGQALWVQRLDQDLENLRAAVACALEGRADPVIAVKLAVALTGFWILRGHASEGRRLVQAMLALPALRDSAMAQGWALYTGAVLASSQGDHESAAEMLERCLQLRRTLGNPVDIAATLSTLAMARLQAGDVARALAGESEALELFAAGGDQRGQTIGHLHLGQFRLWAGQTAEAKDELFRALGFARAIANQELEAECELTLAEVHLREGRSAQAEEAALRSLENCRAVGDKRGEACANWWLGRIGLAGGQPALAHALLQQALAEFKAQEMRPQMLACLDDLALQMLETGQPGTACAMAAAASQARLRWKLTRSPWEEDRAQSLHERMRAALPAAEADRATRTGREWELEDVLKAALGDPKQATVLFGTAA